MKLIKWLKDKYGPEKWKIISVEDVNVTVDYYGVYPMYIIPAKLTIEESNKGNKRYWMKESRGPLKDQRYEVCPTTKRPINENELLKTKRN